MFSRSQSVARLKVEDKAERQRGVGTNGKHNYGRIVKWDQLSQKVFFLLQIRSVVLALCHREPYPS